MKIGYARVSSIGQSLETQIEALEAAGCEKIYREKESGGSTDKRIELDRALDQLRAGDVLVVTRLDRLARSVRDLFEILERMNKAGAGFSCLHQSGVDTNSPTGKLMLGVLGVVAEFERDLIRERQADGIAKAKAKGAYRGRQRTLNPARVVEAYERLGATAAAKELGCARSRVYAIVEEQRRLVTSM